MTSQIVQPVRRIGISSRSMTGIVPGVGQFESSLERDFMELVRFDKNIDIYTPQPLTIQYTSSDGKPRKYTPDGLIEYRRDIYPAAEMPPVLCEIKYRTDFRVGWKVFLPKFKAAKKYAAERGWLFHVYTEREIRSPYLTNVRFLMRYDEPPEPDILLAISEKLTEMRESDPESLMASLFRNSWNRAAALPGLWYLIRHHQVGCNLSEPLTMHSRIWVVSNAL